ncbi:outer membrane beta-barrel protein [Tunicatimonas pelagia]|uniref:outer membrane beta-barrel protein n=1 Tax=Tunicatimonas pelagia TaxID=931531 RepID=UPI0026659322|nr:outer membrane beta-barrel protein [Tunicatimonas pelagia]WKN42816.1 outer membrane beta-barrel protein [Tunicatimonas pelagia]
MKYFAALSFLFFASVVQAQTFKLSGVVVDSIDQNPLPGATILLSDVSNEQKTRAVIADESGKFSFESLPATGCQIRITYVGYKPYEKWVMLRNADRNLGKIILAPSVQTLKELKISGQVLPTVQNGDTTEYNADAFKVTPDADAADLIKKMPGVVVQNGQVQAQGEDVQQVLVDGKEFFGNDPTLALRTLPAEVIDKIQVYDRQSDQAQFTGFDDGETVKTINIITKINKRNGQFGKVYAGYGYDDKYQLGGNINIFDKDRRVSMIGQANNINQQNFANEDLLGVVSSTGGGRRGGFRGGRPGGGAGSIGGRGRRNSGGSNVNDFLVGQQSGISTTNAYGLNYTDSWGERWETSGSYFFNSSANDAVESLNRTFFLEQDATQEYQEENQNYSDNFNHRLNMRMTYQINSRNSLIIQPRVSFQQNQTSALQTGVTEQEERLLNQTNNSSTSDIGGYNFANNLLFRHRFEKRGRTISARLRTTVNQQDGFQLLLAENRSFGTNQSLNDTINQETDFARDGWNVGGNLVYTEPLGPGMVQITAETNRQTEFSNKKTFGFNEALQEHMLLDSALSNEFASIYQTQSVGTGYRFFSGGRHSGGRHSGSRHSGAGQARGFMGMISVKYQWANLRSDQVFPSEGFINQDFANLLPSAMLRYKISDSKNLRLFYRTSTQAPSVTQLQDVIDNSNPLQLTVGNSALDQEYRHNLFLRYSSVNADKSNTFFALLAGSITDNYVGNSTFIANQDTLINGSVLLAEGGQLTQAINIGQQRSIRTFVTYGQPINWLKSNLNINLSGNIAQTPGLINEQQNKATNSTAGLGLTLSSNISENVDFTISSTSNYNWVSNSIRSELNDQFVNQSTNGELTWIFGKGLVFRTQLNHQLFSGLTEGFDQNFVLWNMSVGKKFLKDRRGELQLSVFDLLKQNQSVQRNITESYIEDVQTQVLQQYFMLTFTYQVRNFKL